VIFLHGRHGACRSPEPARGVRIAAFVARHASKQQTSHVAIMHRRSSAGKGSIGAEAEIQQVCAAKLQTSNRFRFTDGTVFAGDGEAIVRPLEDRPDGTAPRATRTPGGLSANAAIVALNGPGLVCAARRMLAASLARDVLGVAREYPLA
jgi:hypothetical protein